jgi:cold shock CspA family protein
VTRQTGVVFREFKDRGYCFVRDRDGVSRFLHVSAFEDPSEFDKLEVGSSVEFTPVLNQRGPSATMAVLVGDSSSN